MFSAFVTFPTVEGDFVGLRVDTISKIVSPSGSPTTEIYYDYGGPLPGLVEASLNSFEVVSRINDCLKEVGGLQTLTAAIRGLSEAMDKHTKALEASLAWNTPEG